MTPNPRPLLAALLKLQVDFIVVGGMAMVLHGSARTTQDLDLCYARTDDNLSKLAEAMAPFAPRLRGAPEGLSFRLDAAALRSGLNFTLTTIAGDVDLLGELAGAGGYEDIAPRAQAMAIYGLRVRVIDLDSLTKAKTAAGRLKDVLDVAELREIQARRRTHG